MLLARCQKSREVRIGKILTVSIDERIFCKLENRFEMITDRNIKVMSFSRWMAMVLFVSRLSIFNTMRTRRVKPGLFSFSIRENVRNV